MTTTMHQRIVVDAAKLRTLRRNVEVCLEFADSHAVVKADGFLFGVHEWLVVRVTDGWFPGGKIVAECLATGEVCEFLLS